MKAPAEARPIGAPPHDSWTRRTAKVTRTLGAAGAWSLDVPEHYREPERHYGLRLVEIAMPFVMVLGALAVGYFMTVR